MFFCQHERQRKSWKHTFENSKQQSKSPEGHRRATNEVQCECLSGGSIVMDVTTTELMGFFQIFAVKTSLWC